MTGSNPAIEILEISALPGLQQVAIMVIGPGQIVFPR
jgi:hypothetical protein